MSKINRKTYTDLLDKIVNGDLDQLKELVDTGDYFLKVERVEDALQVYVSRELTIVDFAEILMNILGIIPEDMREDLVSAVIKILGSSKTNYDNRILH